MRLLQVAVIHLNDWRSKNAAFDRAPASTGRPAISPRETVWLPFAFSFAIFRGRIPYNKDIASIGEQCMDVLVFNVFGQIAQVQQALWYLLCKQATVRHIHRIRTQ